MDSSHGHPHSHSHNHSQTLHLQQPEDNTTTTTQTIEIPGASHPTSPPASTPDYEYQPTHPTPPPPKRSNEPQPPSDEAYPVPKRIRVDESGEESANSSCPSPITPSCPEATGVERGSLERSSSHRFKPLGGHRPFRSKSLPASLRPPRRKKPVDNHQHVPPVTLNTLRELDLHEIYRNPKLRHDVVFDSQLHFRPNLDGSRGRKKREQADIYWKLVLHECEMLFANVRTRQHGCAGLAIKLPILFSTMRDILLTLVPKSDRGEVEAALDPPLLMQQLEHDILDFKKLSEWLAGVLKAHCAPMRDQWVEQMVARVAYGVDNGRTSALVDGLKMVFSILEAMKLDVANHQIRTLRPHLVSTAVQFEQGYFQERIESGRLDMAEPREWFSHAVANTLWISKATDSSVAFAQLLTGTVAPSQYDKFPATFVFDYERLEGLRDDIREATCLKLAILFFRQLTLSARRDIDAATVKALRVQILAILGEEEGPARWVRMGNAVALHIAQAATEFNNGGGFASESLIKLAENWLGRHLQLNSPVYTRVEQEVLKEVSTMVEQVMKGWSSLSTFPIMQSADPTGSSVELASISQRISHIAYLHWRIFGQFYRSTESA